jgi:hypothetical protein
MHLSRNRRESRLRILVTWWNQETASGYYLSPASEVIMRRRNYSQPFGLRAVEELRPPTEPVVKERRRSLIIVGVNGNIRAERI